MDAIEGLLPGSKFKAWHCDESFTDGIPTEFIIEYVSDEQCLEGYLGNEYFGEFDWSELHRTKIEAFDAYISSIKQEALRLQVKAMRLEDKRDQYRDPNVVKAERLAKQREYERKQQAEEDRINSPG